MTWIAALLLIAACVAVVVLPVVFILRYVDRRLAEIFEEPHL